jgi:hypothetical protein
MNYTCKNCSYETRLFSDMTRHLSRKNKCKKKLIGFNNNYNYEEIIKLSLIPHTNGKQEYDNNSLKNKNQNILSKDKFFEILISIDKNKLKICPLCNKSFDKIINLKHHFILYCVSLNLEENKDKKLNENITINGNNNNIIKGDQIINNTTNIINNNNITIIPPLSFNNDWDVTSKIKLDKSLY